MKWTLRKVINAFLRWANAALAPNTVAAYGHHLRRFARAIGNKDAKRLRAIDLTGWGKSWHEYQAVIRCFNWAVDEAKILRSHPFLDLSLPPRNERLRILSPAEMQGFLRGTRPAGRGFFLALRETMARPQEIRAACWHNLQSEDPCLVIEDALREGKALIVLRDFKDRRRRRESTRPRVLLVSRRLGRLILRLRRSSAAAADHIFLNSRGVPWTRNGVRCLSRRVRRRLGLAADANGENVVAYTFRHSRATLAASKGIVDRLLSDILGHVETRTTRRYVHLHVGHLREALSKLEGKPRVAPPAGHR